MMKTRPFIHHVEVGTERTTENLIHILSVDHCLCLCSALVSTGWSWTCYVAVDDLEPLPDPSTSICLVAVITVIVGSFHYAWPCFLPFAHNQTYYTSNPTGLLSRAYQQLISPATARYTRCVLHIKGSPGLSLPSSSVASLPSLVCVPLSHPLSVFLSACLSGSISPLCPYTKRPFTLPSPNRPLTLDLLPGIIS